MSRGSSESRRELEQIKHFSNYLAKKNRIKTEVCRDRNRLYVAPEGSDEHNTARNEMPSSEKSESFDKIRSKNRVIPGKYYNNIRKDTRNFRIYFS